MFGNDEQRGCEREHAAADRPAVADRQLLGSGEPIDDPAAEHGAERGAGEHKAGEQAGFGLRNAAAGLQVFGIPGEVEVRIEGGAGDHQNQQPDGRMADHLAPGNRQMLAARARGAFGEQPFLGRVHSAVFGRFVAEPGEEDDRPSHARRPENEERSPPVAPFDQVGDDRRRHRSAQQRRGLEHGLDASAFREGKPACDNSGRIRVGSRFARSKQESHNQERPEARAKRGQRGERGPPHHDASEHPARAIAIAPMPCRQFEQAVGQRERHQDVAGLFVGETERLLDLRQRLADADAVDVQDERHRAQQREDCEPNRGGARRVSDVTRVGIAVCHHCESPGLQRKRATGGKAAIFGRFPRRDLNSLRRGIPVALPRDLRRGQRWRSESHPAIVRPFREERACC